MNRTLLLTTFLAPWMLIAAEPIVIPLWPEGAGEPDGFVIEPESLLPAKNANDTVKRLTHVSQPTLTLFQPEKPNGTAVIVCPGGGYNILAIDHEGTQVCDWLVSNGVTAALLKYRVPRRLIEHPSKYPLQDAQRALCLLRSRAPEWDLDPQRLGILGFSAGGHLSIMAALHANDRTYPQNPSFDVADATPNFVIPVYPAYLLEETPPLRLKPDLQIGENSPAMCLIHADDDKHSAIGSAMLYLEYKKLSLPTELHIFEKGGHGFGMKTGDLPVNAWPQRVLEWMKARGLVPTVE